MNLIKIDGSRFDCIKEDTIRKLLKNANEWEWKHR